MSTTDEYRDADRALLMSSIAHEIGNFLNGILGIGQLMAADTEHPLPAPQLERLRHLQSAAGQLRYLMRDLTDAAAVQAGRLSVSPRPLAVGPCVEAAVADLEAMAAVHDVAVRLDIATPSALAIGDEVRLRQCVVNLVGNSIKYNRQGGWVQVTVDADDAGGRITVEDNGIGMTAEQLSHLFEPFNRLGRQAHAAWGAGLGLALTRELVQAMGGRLDVESKPGKGTRFTIHLCAPRPGLQVDPCSDAQADSI